MGFELLNEAVRGRAIPRVVACLSAAGTRLPAAFVRVLGPSTKRVSIRRNRPWEVIDTAFILKDIIGRILTKKRGPAFYSNSHVRILAQN